jgi:K+-sensing histidine kinase KdpD
MNNELGVILATASANLDPQPDGSPADRAFDTITKAAERGAMLVQSLLSLARRQPAEAKELDLNVILHDAVRLLEPTTFDKCRLETAFSGDLNPILGDANALSNAFKNLFVNSVEAMAPGGTLTLRTRNLENHSVEVQVEDTGSGMSAETLTKALEPYFTTKGVRQGTGLGLSIVESTIKAHHGQMEIQSEPGQGTLVTLRFPGIKILSQADSPTSEPGADHSHHPQKMIVADDGSGLHRVRWWASHSSAMAAGGVGARTRLGAEVVVLGLNLPGPYGTGTLLRIRAWRPTLPVER